MRMEQRQVIGQRQDLRQELRLSARQLQTLRLLQINRLALESELNQELVDNPALDLAPEDLASEMEIDAEGVREDPAGQEDRQQADRQEEGFDLIGERNFASDDYEPGGTRAAPDDEDAKHGALAQAPDRPESLEQHLLLQLRMLTLTPEVDLAVRALISQLDVHGFLPGPLETVLPSYTNDEAEIAREALAVLQALEPIGIGSSGPAEAMLIQVPENDPDRELFRQLLTQHWDDLLHNRVRQISSKMGLPVEEVGFLLECLRQFNPYPARDFGVTTSPAIRPDLVFERDPEASWEWRCRALEEWSSRLRVRQGWLGQLARAKASSDKQTERFINQNIRRAEDLIKDLQWVRSTLERVGDYVLRNQLGFMENGVSGLKPLRMEECAAELGIDVSTVSRAVAEKYVDTPHGIMALRFFFSSGMKMDDGEEASRHAIQEELRSLVEAEPADRPLSDEAIMASLADKGFRIKRRTVAKYREELGIPNSRQRVRV
jgi:RNA polymerase sigma-54 factor